MKACLRHLTFIVLNLLICYSLDPSTIVMAINSGGSAYTSSYGFSYIADTYSTGGSNHVVPGTSIANTVDDSMYLSERYGTSNWGYNLPLTTDGTYVLILQFCETYFTTTNSRIFTVKIGNYVIANNLDLVATAGAFAAYDIFTTFVLASGIVSIGETAITGAYVSNCVVVTFNVAVQNPQLSGLILVRGDCNVADYCNMCYQAKCMLCNAPTLTCKTCITNASPVSGVCECNPGTYWVTSSRTCDFCDNLCIACSSDNFICTTCSGTNVLISSVCLRACPYGFGSPCTSTSTAVIDQNFADYFSGVYGLFQTGSSSNTYFFFNSPDEVDPIPAKSRGLYFSGGSYLQTTSTVYISLNFSIGMWIWVLSESGEILTNSSSNKIAISALGIIAIILESISETTTLITTTALNSNSVWSYISFIVSFSSSSASTTIVPYLNNSPQTSTTSSGYIYRDALNNFLILGKSSSNSFLGFIYQFTLWNIAVSNFDTQYLDQICGTGAAASCLWTCTLSQWMDGEAPINCNSCESGCVRSVSCNVCYDPLCSICTGFLTGLCTQCVSNASGTPCACNAGYILSSDGFSCIPCFTGCASCTGTLYYQCNSCLSSYFLLKTMCLTYCPSGYTADSSGHSCVLSSSNPLSIALQNLIQLNTVSGISVGSSNANSYPNWEITDPIPSIYRGYYFSGSNYMNLTSFIISPYFSLLIWVNPLNDGYLFMKFDGTTKYSYITFSSGIPSMDIILADSNFLSVSGLSSVLSGWHYLSFIGSLSSGNTVVHISIDGSSFSSATSATSSYYKDLGALYIAKDMTASGGFTGFLWSLKIYNDDIYASQEWVTSGCPGCAACPSELICPDSCPFGQFYSTSCVSCTGACHYGCRSTLTCRLCKDKECLSCNAFDGPCTSCITNASPSGTTCVCNNNAFWEQSSDGCQICDNLCSQCQTNKYFLCSICLVTYIPVSNVCLGNCPYGFISPCVTVTMPVIDAAFNADFQGTYSIFTTGSSASSYQFFNSPETYDPIPAKQRGLYFNGSQYLISNTNIYLSHSFTMGLWIYVTTDGDIISNSRITVDSSGSINIPLESPSETTSSKTLSSASFTPWKYLSFTCSFDSSAITTTLIVYNNNNQVASSSAYNALIYRDQANQNIKLGGSSSSHFTGFIYKYQLWNIAIFDFTAQVDEICGSGLLATCLWPCDINNYLDSTICNNCDSSCSLGCTRTGSCNICDDPLCSICSGFDVNKCSTCVSHAHGTPCSCDSDYYLSPDSFSCLLCFPGCSSCSSSHYYQCSACDSSYYLLNALCDTQCPSGYNQNSETNKCDLTNNLIVDLELDDYIVLDTLSGFTVGSNNENVYPIFDANDPIPAINRGYYFTGQSYMSSSIVFSPYFSVMLWVKAIDQGVLIQNNDGAVSYFEVKIDTSGYPNLNLILEDASSLNAVASQNVISNWHYLSFSGLINGDGTYSSNIYIDSTLLITSTSASEAYLRDSRFAAFLIGFDLTFSTGFKGFLWNLKIYNDENHANSAIQGCSNLCASCPSDLTCLSECSLNEFPDSCMSCKSSCSTGCVSSLTCRLCKNKECLSCNSFSNTCTSCITNARLVGTDCQCNENALWDSSTESCELCHSTCESCSTLAFTGCISCANSLYKFENLCIPYCPTGYFFSSNQCIEDLSLNSFVFYLRPDKIEDIVHDSKSSIAVETGQNSQFYPFYTESDPIAAEYRGYYFTGTSYMQVTHGNFLFAPKFTILAWIRVISENGDLLVKETADSPNIDFLKLGLDGYHPVFELHIIDGATLIVKSNDPISSGWTHLGIASDINNTPSQQIIIYLNGASNSFISEKDLWFEDLQSSYIITIGASYDGNTLNNFFKGFLWDLMIWNKFIEPSLFISTSCNGCSICPGGNSGECLVDCDISKYWDGNSCLNCNEACSEIRCVRPDKNCNLCADVICSVCDNYNTTCITCRSNAHLSVDRCECDDGFYWDEIDEKCSPCHDSCKSCRDENFMSCLVCKNDYYLINGICLEFCPLGYSYGSSVCTFNYEHIFDLDLNTLNGIIYDKKSLVPVITGSTANFYKNYDKDDPIPATLRGFYFNGNSSILHLPEFGQYTTPKLIMAPVFSYSIWFNTESPSITLASIVDSSKTTEFEISLLNTFPVFTINLQYIGIFSHTCENSAYLSEWNHLMISIELDASGHSFANCIINTIADSLSDTGISYYKVTQSGMKNIIGAKLQNSNIVNYFQGFIYSVQIFNTIKDISDLALYQPSCSDSCVSCLPTKMCIPNCSIEKYWIGAKYNYCSDCHSNCTFGCKDSSLSCNLCSSSLCKMCSGYKAESCTDCIENADNAPFCKCSGNYGISKDFMGCVECEPREFSDEGVCKLCPSKCISCENSNKCSSCIQNAGIFNGTCRCEIGYNGTDECLFIPFNVSLAVNLDNSLNLTFSDELANNLSAYDIYIEIENLEAIDFSYSLEKCDEDFYIILLSTSTEIKEGAGILISLVNLTHFVSKSNGLLMNSTLKGALYHYNPYSGSQTAAKISIQSSAVFKASSGLILALSFINPSPAGLWSTMNVLQIIYYLGLSNIPMSESFFEIVTNMNAMKYLPNIFSYFLDKDIGNAPFDQAVKFGYKSDLLFLNAGCDITLFLAILTSWTAVYLLHLIPYPPISKLFSSAFSYYKYSIFLRFWIQAYLDIGTASLLSLLYFSVNNPTQIVSSLLSLASITLAFVTPIALLKLSSNNLSRIQQEDKEYCSKWNSLFYEFKNDKGLISTQYYFVFFMRRLIYMINLVLLGQHSETQISINILLSFATVVYLIKYQPYNERFLQIANIVSEAAILLLMGIMSASLYDVPNVVLTNYEFTMALLILVVIGIQTLASISMFIKVCYKIIRKDLSTGSRSDHKYAISTVQPEVVAEDLERPTVTQETELDRTAYDKQMFIISEEDEVIVRT